MTHLLMISEAVNNGQKIADEFRGLTFTDFNSIAKFLFKRGVQLSQFKWCSMEEFKNGNNSYFDDINENDFIAAFNYRCLLPKRK